MRPWVTVAATRTADGAELVLWRRGADWEVRADGITLMSSRIHGSEMALARIAFDVCPDARTVLLGGLGLGFTLRAALDRLPSDGQVVVAELAPALVDWNLTHVAFLAGRPLDDPRVKVRVGDVRGRITEAHGTYDAILMDVDNGPVALVHGSNAWLYGHDGIRACRAALSRHGVLTVWSAANDESYLRRLRRHGFEATVRPVRAQHGSVRRHFVFVASPRRPPGQDTRMRAT